MSVSNNIIEDAEIFFAHISFNTCWIFVSLKSSNNLIGWGEATLNKSEKLIQDFARNIFPKLIGCKLEDLAKGNHDTFSFNDLNSSALSSAIISASLDAMAKAKNISLSSHIGNLRNKKIEIYANFNRRTKDRTPEGMKKSAQLVKKKGYKSFKIAPFDELSLYRSKKENYSFLSKCLERIELISNVIGKESKLMIDCHWRFDYELSEILINELSSYNIYWLECPIIEDIENIKIIKMVRNLANKKGIKLAGLETKTTKETFLPFLTSGCYDVMMPDVKYTGGAIKMLEIGKLFDSFGVEFSPHNPSGPICHAHSLQICSAFDKEVMLEHQFDESHLFNELIYNKLPKINNGLCAIDNKSPGIGIEVDLSNNCIKKQIKNLDSKKEDKVFNQIANLSKVSKLN